jgi:hypothetical protein
MWGEGGGIPGAADRLPGAVPLQIEALDSVDRGERWFLQCINQFSSPRSTRVIARSMLDVFTARRRVISAPDSPSSR